MPEVRHNFTAGKMNKDLDERLVPNGEYRHALNVEVSTSEGSEVGTVQNILGNKRVEQVVGEGFKCVGSIADEKNNKLYWFISKYEKDVILEYDIDNDIASPVLVDLKGGTQKSVLKFFGNTITGINIIDNLLFWSDNKGEPKKINIKRCKEGTPNINTHTQINFSNNSFTGIAVEYTTPDFDSPSGSPELHPPLLPIEKRSKIGMYTAYERRRLAAAMGVDFNIFLDDYGNIKDGNYSSAIIDNTSSNSFDANGVSSTGNIAALPMFGYQFKARHYRDGELLGGYVMQAFDSKHGLNMRYYPGDGQESTEKDFKVGDVIFAENTKLDIEEKHITVIKPKPLKAPSIKINYKEQTQSTNKKPNLFEEQFPRFSYRYKYADGEFSAFAPFTEPVFNAQYTQNTDKSADGSVLHSKDDIYDIKDPKNKAMVNAIHSVDLMDFITIDTPEDVVGVDLLYKKEDSPVIYSIGTVKHTDFEWHASAFNHEFGQAFVGGMYRYSSNIYYPKVFAPAADGGYNSGRYTVKNENIYAALPANQLLRPWDNVPRKALAQEVSGSRIVYGNYLQNYTIGSKPKVFVDYSDRKKTTSSFDVGGLPSVKSQRNYQLGVIYCDEFGRETPVFTSSGGAVNIPWAENDGLKNASKSNQIIASVESNFPDWVDSIKFFIKENSGEYYNLAMERAWTGKSTYELDNSEGHLWMSFPSSDRNKITKDDSIILKKKIGVGEKQISFENKFTVIDIKDEAPDAIKYELVNLGTWKNDSSNPMTVDSANYDKLFSYGSQRPDKLQDTIIIDISAWNSGGEYRAQLIVGTAGTSDAPTPENLYVSWSRDGGASSSKYKVSGGWKGASGYVLKLNRNITEKDANIAHVDGNAVDSQNESHVHEDLIVQVEKRVAKEDENFSGQFFVKISKNQITSIVETGNELSNLDKFEVVADQGVWYWRDDTNGTTQSHNSNPFAYQSGQPYGNNNYFGDTTGHSNNNNIQQDGGGNTNQNATGGTARMTDWHEMWENILAGLTGKPRWFVDAMHMASGQSDESDYAKYNCVTWAGATFNPNQPIIGLNLNRAWSYPPLKKWFSEVTENEVEVEGNEGSYFTEDNPSSVISTSNLFDQNENWFYYDDSEDVSGDIIGNVGLQIDGWVGVSQNVRRVNYPQTSSGNLTKAENHINGLEGLVTTNEYHVTGPRRWVSGMNGTEFGNGEDTKTYSSTGEEIDKHFMHLSFFAPGKDLHDNNWHFDEPTLYGKDTWMDNLQGIWGGGVFTGTSIGQKFGSDGDDVNKHFHLAMEGNYAAGDTNDHQVYSTPPGPGSGFGYNLDYRELHERQWDPTFNSENDPENRIRDFIRNLFPGSKFRFNHKASGATLTTAELDDAVYTIKKVHIKKLYNHTSWRTPHNQFITALDGYVWNDPSAAHDAYNSVEDMALIWLNGVDADGDHTTTMVDTAATTYGNTQQENFKKKIVDFGSAHNRRVCYVIELDKNPVSSNSIMGNPLNSTTNSADGMSADLDSDNFTQIEFLDPVQDIVLKDLSKFPAIWELSPKKQDVDLDIYYEASNNIPVRINRHTNELFAPKGCLVEMINPPYNQDYNDVRLVEWNGNTALLEPGFDRGGGGEEIDYSNVKFKFIRRDGSYTVANAGLQQLTTTINGYKTDFVFKQNISEKIQVGLAWYNCFSFGNGLESNRIKDGFNNMFIVNGVKASTTVQETYEEEHRKHGLIYSGLYNSNSGINDLNQFIMAEKITKDLNPTYGGIQKLFSRDTDLIAFCEDKVLRILANKDAVFNADGNAQLTSNQNFLGQAVPFQGEYGISKNPESFASESYRAYFTDKQRGAILRLSKDGLTPISKAGMHDWFRDNLSKHTSLIGTYDSYKENYNITLSNTYTENIIFNTYFNLGAESEAIDASVLSSVAGGDPISGSAYLHSWESASIETSDAYNFNDSINSYYDAVAPTFKHSVTVTNHPEIPVGHFQTALTPSTPTPSPNIATFVFSEQVGYQAGQAFIQEQAFVAGTAGVNFAQAVYDFTPGNDDGWWYDPDFEAWSSNIWTSGSTSPNDYFDGQVVSRVYREINGANLSGALVCPFGSWGSDLNPTVSKEIFYGLSPSGLNSYTSSLIPKISQCVTKAKSGGQGSYTNKAITFDRPNPSNSYVEFLGVGGTSNNPSAGINGTYATNANIFSPHQQGLYHSSFFNGDEVFIQVELTAFITLDGYSFTSGGQNREAWGYNYIKPRIELYDGSSPLNSNVLVITTTFQALQGTQNDYEYIQGYAGGTTYGNLGGDFVGENASFQYTSNATNLPSDVSWSQVKAMPSNSYRSTFLDTSVGSNFAGATSSPLQHNQTSQAGAVKIIIGMCVKFRDPNQQNSSGAYTGSGDGIEEVQVVDDLRIRISNAKSAASSGYTQSGASYMNIEEFNNSSNMIYPLRQQLWQVNNLKIKKAFGVVAPHTDFVQEVAETPYQAGQEFIAYNPGIATAYYDDPLTTGVVENLTEAQITNAGGAENAQGEWVLNQNAIDAWNNTYPGGVIYPQDNIPDYHVDAFVEVLHSGFNWQDGVSFGTHENIYNTQTAAYFGNNRAAIADSAFRMDPSTGILTNTEVTWFKKGSAPADQTPQEGNHGNAGSYFSKDLNDANGDTYYAPLAPATPSPNANSTTPTTQTHTDFVADYWETLTTSAPGVNTASQQIFQLSAGDELQVGKWYMVDVELNDDFHNTSNAVYNYNGGTPPSIMTGAGTIQVRGVGTDTLAANINYSEIGGVGYNWGSGTDRHAGCVPTFRTRYSDDKWVFRTVFKLESDSKAVTSSYLDRIQLRFYGWRNDELRINKVICKKVSYVNNTGGSTDWNRYLTSSNPSKHLQINAFTESKLYYSNGMLCYDECKPADNYLNGTSGTEEGWWNQVFAPGKEITNVGSGWVLKFKVNKNPKTNFFSGKLGVKVTGTYGDVTNTNLAYNEFTGLLAHIEHEGSYKINFDMTGAKNNNWSIEKDSSTYASTFFDEYGALFDAFGVGADGTIDTADDIGISNAIGFYNASGATATPLSCGISEVYLTQTDTIFSGGQVGSWDFDGFDSTSEQFITWDIYWPDGQVGTNADGRIQFSSCPSFDPGFGNGNVMISANQYIDKVINRYEKYEISFNFRMQEHIDVNGSPVTVNGAGLFHMYYFNGSGYGFRINDIGDGTDHGIGAEGSTPTNPNYTKTAVNDGNGDFMWWKVTKIVGIGDGSTPNNNAYSEYAVQNVEALRDTLVIRRDGNSGSQDLTGWIDDISMKRVYDVEMNPGPDGIPGNVDDVPVYPETTLTFSEDVKGWTSFKSFTPESGLSLSKKYFTLKDGFLYQHYKPLKLNKASEQWHDCNYNEAENYNHFYDHLPTSQYNYSEIVAVINVEPNVVKTFKTISYEGSQAYVNNPGAAALTKPKLINQNNAIAWSLNDYTTGSYPNIDGWKCVDVKTDLNSGQLLDFIKKEGKWFGYIKGKQSIVGELDASRFSVQGIGSLKSPALNHINAGI